MATREKVYYYPTLTMKSDISSEENENVLTGCYENETQYTEFELKEMKTTESGSDSCSEEEFDSSRLENLHLYTWEKCVITFSMAFKECKCCREPASLLRESEK